jgi:hypothetical protein
MQKRVEAVPVEPTSLWPMHYSSRHGSKYNYVCCRVGGAASTESEGGSCGRLASQRFASCFAPRLPARAWPDRGTAAAVAASGTALAGTAPSAAELRAVAAPLPISAVVEFPPSAAAASALWGGLHFGGLWAFRSGGTHVVPVDQTCTDEAGEATGWQIVQIQDVVRPNEQQQVALDALGDGIVKASQVIRAGCPTNIAFTPTGRLEQMQKRVEALIQAVSIMRPAVEEFYRQLSDEQRARFNALDAPAREREGDDPTASARPGAKAACGADVTPWPTDSIEQAVDPTDAQRVKLDDLKAAAARAADLIKASCPAETPLTPPDRLAAVAMRLDAVLRGVQTVRAAVDDLYSTLTDEQKARFNTP